MEIIRSHVLFLILITIFLRLTYSQEPVNDVIQFNQEEKLWLESNKVITFGADFKWPPFDFADKNDKHAGLSADYIREIEKCTGLKINVVPGVWSYVLNKAKKGEYDGISASVKTLKRQEYLLFSEPFIEIPLIIVVRTDRNDINKFNDLKGKTIAVNKDSYIHEYILNNKLNVFPILKSSNKECIEAVSFGQADAYIGNLPAYTHITQEELVTNLKVVNEIPGWNAPISIAICKNDTTLLNIVNKVLRNIPEKKQREFRFKWFGESILTSRKIELTRREHEWLSENPTIKIAGDPDWPPNSMYDQDSNYVGILADLWKIISDMSGINFVRVRSNNWSETLNMMKLGEIDIIDGVSETPERSKFMNFSDVLFTSQVVIIGRNDQDFVDGLKKIGKLKLGVQEGTSEIELIKRDFPELELCYYTDPDQAYNDLVSKKIDLYLRHYSEFQYTKKEKMLTALKVVGVTEFSRDYKIGVSKYKRELLSIINKSIAKITIEERNAIFEKWHGLDGNLIDYSLVWKVVLISLIVLVVIFYWNRRLSHEIALRKKTEEQLRNAKLVAEKATNAKSEFLANMSHEIRTPMNAIIGFTELMEKTPLTNQQLSYISTIRSGGDTLLGLINDILDLSKIEANKMELIYSSFNIRSTIFEVEQFFKNEITRKGLELLINYSDKIPKNIILDEGRLRQILFNLISNAIKFTNSGSIVIDIEFIEINTGKNDLIFVIEDSGIGIKEEYLANIFEPFEQVGDMKLKRITKGTGLGLTITKKLIEMMNGSIFVESKLGVGTKFKIIFKNVAVDGYENNTISENSDASNILFEKINVLIVDDVESNRFLIKELCKEYGFNVYEAENGKVAVEKAKLYVPDLILMDIRMPVMDGYEAIELLKKDSSLRNIPVIAITASVMETESKKLKASKFSGFLRKPISRIRLTDELKEFISYTQQNVKELDIVVIDDVTDPEKLYAELNGKIYETYKRSVENHNLNDIKEFADRLKELATNHNSNSLLKYAKDMKTAARNFDIDMIKILLSKFDEMLIRKI